MDTIVFWKIFKYFTNTFIFPFLWNFLFYIAFCFIVNKLVLTIQFWIKIFWLKIEIFFCNSSTIRSSSNILFDFDLKFLPFSWINGIFCPIHFFHPIMIIFIIRQINTGQIKLIFTYNECWINVPNKIFQRTNIQLKKFKIL